MQTETYHNLSGSMLGQIFPPEELPQQGASTMPLFEAMHIDFLKVIAKMECVSDAVYNQFSFAFGDESYPITFSVEKCNFTYGNCTLLMVSSIDFKCEVGDGEKSETVIHNLVEAAIQAIRSANLDFWHYKAMACERIKRIGSHVSEPNIGYYIRLQNLPEEV